MKLIEKGAPLFSSSLVLVQDDLLQFWHVHKLQDHLAMSENEFSIPKYLVLLLPAVEIDWLALHLLITWARAWLELQKFDTAIKTESIKWTLFAKKN